MSTKVATPQTKIITGPMLGDPEGMRPSIRRYYEGSVGVYELADGREAHVTWLHNGQTTVDVVVWIPGESQPSHQTERRMMDNVYRIHAARVSERFLVELES